MYINQNYLLIQLVFNTYEALNEYFEFRGHAIDTWCLITQNMAAYRSKLLSFSQVAPRIFDNCTMKKFQAEK